MFSVTWPERTERSVDSLVTMFGGHVYRLVRDPFRRDYYKIYCDGMFWNALSLPYSVSDFIVFDRYIFLATENPACLYMSFNVPHFQWSTLMYSESPVRHVSLGNYHNNPLIVYCKENGEMWSQVLSSDSPFMRSEQQLCLHSSPTTPIFLGEQERFVCIPFFPRHYGVIGVLSTYGLRFHSLRPYYSLQPFSDTVADVPPFYNLGDPDLRGMPPRLRVNGYKLFVEITDNLLTFKYHMGIPQSAPSQDWITVSINGQIVQPNTLFSLLPKTDYRLDITANQFLEDMEVRMSLPVLLTRQGQDDFGSSVLKIPSLNKGQTYSVKMSGDGVQQSVNPQLVGFDLLARFLDKIGMSIRASVWGV